LYRKFFIASRCKREGRGFESLNSHTSLRPNSKAFFMSYGLSLLHITLYPTG